MKMLIARYTMDGKHLETFQVDPINLDNEMQCWRWEQTVYNQSDDSMTFHMYDIQPDEDELEHAFCFHVDYQGETILEVVDPMVTFYQILEFLNEYEDEHNVQFTDSTIRYHPINNHFYLEMIG